MKKVIISVILLFSSVSYSMNIKIDPQSFQGQYSVMGVTPSLSGPQVVDLKPGLYHILVGAISSFSIEVSVDGMVKAHNGMSAIGGQQSLIFQNLVVNIDSADYEGDWSLPAIAKTQKSGSKNISLVKGIKYLLQVAAVDSFIFAIDGESIISLNKSSVAQVDGADLVFKTQSISVNPQAYQGYWSMPSIVGQEQGLKEDIKLVPGLRYLMQIASVSSFYFNIDEMGQLQSDNKEAAEAFEGQLKFKTLYVNFKADDDVLWELSLINEVLQGSKEEVSLIPSLNYRLDLASGETKNFLLDSQCIKQAIDLSVGDKAFQYSCQENLVKPFLCDQEMALQSRVSCKGRFVAKNQNDLDIYKESGGFINGRYRHLIVKFGFAGENLEIHSPCSIRVKTKKPINAKNICLDAQRGVKIKARTKINAESIYLYSAAGRVAIKGRSEINADYLEIKSKKDQRIKPRVRLNVAEFAY